MTLQMILNVKLGKTLEYLDSLAAQPGDTESYPP